MRKISKEIADTAAILSDGRKRMIAEIRSGFGGLVPYSTVTRRMRRAFALGLVTREMTPRGWAFTAAPAAVAAE